MGSDDEPAVMEEVEETSKPAAETSELQEKAAATELPSRSRSRSPKRSRSRSRSHNRSRSRSRGRSRSPRRSSSPRRGGGRERRSLSPASRRLAERRKKREQQERERAREFEQRRRNEQRFDRRRSPPPAMQRARSPPVSHDVAVARLRGEASAKDDAVAAAAAPVERSETCPVLLRVFPSLGHHEPAEYGRGASDKAALPKDEIQLYVWADTTLRELCTLVRQKFEPAQHRSARLHFALIFPGKNGMYASRELGLVFASGRPSREEGRTLREMKVMAGDYVDIAVQLPSAAAAAAVGEAAA